MTLLPDPPVNVRLVFSDGEEVPVDTVYRGLHEDTETHEWEVVNVPQNRLIRGLAVDMLPAKTAVKLAGRWESM